MHHSTPSPHDQWQEQAAHGGSELTREFRGSFRRMGSRGCQVAITDTRDGKTPARPYYGRTADIIFPLRICERHRI